MKVQTLTLFAMAFLSVGTFSLTAQAHSGRTNSEGCHNNRNNGTYHCHNSGAQSSEPAVEPEVTSVEEWRVVSVGDGDTIRVNRDDETTTVRLACIDAV